MSQLEPLPAATVTLVRDSDQGPEVLMLQRNFQSGFMPGMYMFPGGALDHSDYSEQACALCTGLDDATASRILKLERSGLAYWVAAIRESFEEAGILLACNARGEIIALDEPVTVGRFRRHRHALNAGNEEFTKLVIKEQLRLAVDQLVYFGHWITPLGAPRRYDTRFFVARAPAAQEPLHDNVEAIAHTWMRPQTALAAHARGEFNMRTPTHKTLESFAAFESVHALIQAMRDLNEIPAMLPRITTDGRRLLPGEAGYEDAATTERPGRWENIIPGVAARVNDLVVRLTAPNPGVMTGPGTNSYIVGHDEIVLIDPGPESGAHCEVLLRAVGARLRWILCTHTHLDHSPGARAIKAATGAQVCGFSPTPSDGRQDMTFAPDRVLRDGDSVECGNFRLRAVHTPGHASNHLCYLLEERKLLFTGDHVMQGSTVVISPPDGDMQAYFRSLERLFELDIAAIAPGHGHVIETPHDEARRLIAHRLKREQKVLDAFARKNPATLDELLPIVYADTPARLHPVARRSLHAHLIKLERESRTAETAGSWRVLRGPDGMK